MMRFYKYYHHKEKEKIYFYPFAVNVKNILVNNSLELCLVKIGTNTVGQKILKIRKINGGCK